jgi:protein-S-isoprenylcysteine O-methyltransferase Ste14
MLTALAVTVWRFSLLNIAIFTVFVIVQLLRARWEEKKLARVFPAYGEYCAEAKWL